jgi:hypothetical protein
MKECTSSTTGTRIFQQGRSLLVVESQCTYIYCMECGKVKLLHIHETTRIGPSMMALLSSPACTCAYRHPSTEARARTESQRLLSEMAVALHTGLYTSVDDVLGLIGQLSAREGVDR